MTTGALFVVATPIGNLGDVTVRAVETLRACEGVLAEDTRRARALLAHLGIEGKRIDRLDAHASEATLARAVERMLRGERLALVSDAGTPAVSDPGSAIVRAAVGRGLTVVPVPGASAVLCALAASGLGGDGPFRFFGFLPRDGGKRRDALDRVGQTGEVAILFEAPARVRATLCDLAETMPERGACVARELTKLHEEVARGTCRELADDPRTWRGEIVIVLGPWKTGGPATAVSEAELANRIDRAIDAGEPSREAAARIAAWSGRSRSAIYQRLISRKRA